MFDINDKITIHSLSASKMGMQYIIKTEKALNNLKPIEMYYLSEKEKNDCKIRLNKRTLEIETKLKMAKRQFKSGKYIEEIL